jgi:hypothetical protein
MPSEALNTPLPSYFSVGVIADLVNCRARVLNWGWFPLYAAPALLWRCKNRKVF